MNPIRHILPVCCPSVTNGAARILPPTSMRNARRSISSSSLDDFVGSDHQRLWNGQPKCLGGVEVDHQLELGGLLDGEIGRCGAFENLVDEVRGAATDFAKVSAVRHEPAGFDKVADPVDPRHAMLEGELYQLYPVSVGEGANRSDNTSDAILLHSCDGRIQILTPLDRDERQRNANLSRSGLQLAASFGRRGLGAGEHGKSRRSWQGLPQQFDELLAGAWRHIRQ